MMRFAGICVFLAVAAGCARCPATGEMVTGFSKPVVSGDWWDIANNPDLGKYTGRNQQPVDFAVWQAADGTWQLWSCIRKCNCGKYTRLFHRWEAANLTDTDWESKGVAMTADTSLGEQEGGLQAPYVFEEGDKYYMFYSDWERICLAVSEDGKHFQRVLNAGGQPDLFSGPWDNTRDAMVINHRGTYYCYYTGHLNEPKNVGAVFCRTSPDMTGWSKPVIVAYGGRAGSTRFSAECPHVIHRPQDGLWYLFRTQRYGKDNITHVYASRDMLDFGINDDTKFVCTLPVAAPEIIKVGGEYYIAALKTTLDGIRMAKLEWKAIRTIKEIETLRD